MRLHTSTVPHLSFLLHHNNVNATEIQILHAKHMIRKYYALLYLRKSKLHPPQSDTLKCLHMNA